MSNNGKYIEQVSNVYIKYKVWTYKLLTLNIYDKPSIVLNIKKNYLEPPITRKT